MVFVKSPFSDLPSLHELKDLILTARGETPADIIIQNVNLVNVLTREIENVSVLIKHKRFAAILENSDIHSYPEALMNIRGENLFLAPSFIDSHVHFESSMLTLTNFGFSVASQGTGLIVIDPHEITNILGSEILTFLSEESKQVPLDVFMEIPSCVPAAIGLETPAHELTSRHIAELFDDPAVNVSALAELMNFPGVLYGVDEILQRILVTRARGYFVEGHAPGLTQGDLNAYIASGVLSDHESTTFLEALEKLRRGMTIQIRNGSVANDLLTLITGFLDYGLQDWHSCVFACDDKHPDDLLDKGHIDYSIKQAISLGLDPVQAIQLATINAARHLHLDKVLGSISPGKWANFVLLDDLDDVVVKSVYFQGQHIAENHELLITPQSTLNVPSSYLNTVHYPTITLNDIMLSFPRNSSHKSQVTVKIIQALEKSLLTKTIIDVIHITKQGFFEPDITRDYLPILVIDRHHNTKNIGKGIIHGFGIKHGAIASTIAHDTHNLVIVGSDYESILTSIHQIRKQKGGIIITQQNRVLASLPLPFGGIMSTKGINETAHSLRLIRKASQQIGCEFHNPEMTLAFMALPVIPELKITDKGLIDVTAFQVTDLIA